MADDTVQVELERLRAENEALKLRAIEGVTPKVSEKGGVSVYRLGRFPVTFYKEPWEKLLGRADDIRTFIAEHETELKTKASDRSAATTRGRYESMPKYRRGSGSIYKKRSVYYVAYYANGKQVCESTGTKDKAEAYGRTGYPEVLKALSKVVEGTPQLQNYEVSNSTFHHIAARA